MSSRALRKLQGTCDIVVPGLEVNVNSESEEDAASGNLVVGTKNKKDKSQQRVNPFDLLNEEADVSTGEVDEPTETKNGGVNAEEADVATGEPITKPKKRKKRKKKKHKGPQVENKTADDASILIAEEDEIDAGVRAVNELLGELPVNSSLSSNTSGITVDTRALLAVEHKYLNPDNEMRRIFGSRVVQAEQRTGTRRRGGRSVHRNTWLSRPKDNWPYMGKSGLTQSLMEVSSGPQVFTFDHNAQYQQAQFEFWDAVESLNPENIVAVLNAHPHHVDSMLQLSEVCRMSEDTQMAAELIERTLFVCECSFHPLYNISSGNCRLEYRRQENRAMFIALFRHILYVGQRGCYRTALELSKVLLSLDPDGDPLCSLLMIDFYAIKAEQFDFIIRLFHEWEIFRNLSQLPNFAFSVPLAMFHQAQSEGTDTAQASAMLQSALLMFPGVLIPLLDHCSIMPDPLVAGHHYFSTTAQLTQPEALKQLIALYIGRCYPCWKEPEVVTWLERTVKEVICTVEAGDVRIQDFAEKRKQRYQGTPRNIYRHIVLAEIKDATAALPPELASSPVLSYDPLPPKDSITSYTRPSRRRVVEQDSNVLTMFFRSLLPNYNPDETVEEVAGAAGGGQELRQGIGALMDAMRDLLNNIQPVPPPRENGEGVQGNEEDAAQWEDNLDEFD